MIGSQPDVNVMNILKGPKGNSALKTLPMCFTMVLAQTKASSSAPT